MADEFPLLPSRERVIQFDLVRLRRVEPEEAALDRRGSVTTLHCRTRRLAGGWVESEMGVSKWIALVDGEVRFVQTQTESSRVRLLCEALWVAPAEGVHLGAAAAVLHGVDVTELAAVWHEHAWGAQPDRGAHFDRIDESLLGLLPAGLVAALDLDAGVRWIADAAHVPTALADGWRLARRRLNAARSGLAPLADTSA